MIITQRQVKIKESFRRYLPHLISAFRSHSLAIFVMWTFHHFRRPENFEQNCKRFKSCLCSLGITIELNSGKRVEWFCSAEIEAEVKTHVCTRNNFSPSSLQELHTMLQKFESWTYLAFRKYILISPDGEMECT